MKPEEHAAIAAPGLDPEARARKVAEVMHERFKQRGIVTTAMWDFGIDIIALAIRSGAKELGSEE